MFRYIEFLPPVTFVSIGTGETGETLTHREFISRHVMTCPAFGMGAPAQAIQWDLLESLGKLNKGAAWWRISQTHHAFMLKAMAELNLNAAMAPSARQHVLAIQEAGTEEPALIAAKALVADPVSDSKPKK